MDAPTYHLSKSLAIIGLSVLLVFILAITIMITIRSIKENKSRLDYISTYVSMHLEDCDKKQNYLIKDVFYCETGNEYYVQINSYDFNPISVITIKELNSNQIQIFVVSKNLILFRNFIYIKQNHLVII